MVHFNLTKCALSVYFVLLGCENNYSPNPEEIARHELDFLRKATLKHASLGGYIPKTDEGLMFLLERPTEKSKAVMVRIPHNPWGGNYNLTRRGPNVILFTDNPEGSRISEHFSLNSSNAKNNLFRESE